MPISVRLKPQLQRLLDELSRRERKSRSAVIHELLNAQLARRRMHPAEALRRVLSEVPGGFGVKRQQPRRADKRAWKR
jgi:predicted transcriptional regulator